MTVRLFIILIINVLAYYNSFCQYGYYNEALLFSQNNIGGSARILGLGGAQVSLGGDLTLAQTNPAGLGMFNRSVATITPSYQLNNANANFLGKSNTSFSNGLNLEQFGVAFNLVAQNEDHQPLKSITVAFTLNKVNNYDNEITYQNRNNTSSIVDGIIYRIGNTPPSELGNLSYAFYDNFLIDEADYSSNSDYTFEKMNDITIISPYIEDGSIDGYSSLVGKNANIYPLQNENISTSGTQTQFNFASGINFNDQIYLGLSLGLVSLNYFKKRTFKESNYQFLNGDPSNVLNSINLSDNLEIVGEGINITIGLIYRLQQNITIGASFISPTYLELNETNDFTLSTSWNSQFAYNTGKDTVQLGDLSTSSDIVKSKYTIKTPSLFSLGATYFFGKRGFLTSEIGIKDYSTAVIQSNDFSTNDDNQVIKNSYQMTVNYKVGAEFRFNILRFRAGFNYETDPYKNSHIDRSKLGYATGFGIIQEFYFVDIAFTQQVSQTTYYPYYLNENSPEVTVFQTNNKFLITVGLNF